MIKRLRYAALCILGVLTGYFIFLLFLKVSGNLDYWKERIRMKYGVGIWDL